jgi:hypothetical protein
LADRICADSGRPTVTRTEVSRYEREVRLPTQASLMSLAAALELPPALLAWAAEELRDRRQRHVLNGRPGLRPKALVFASVEALSSRVQQIGDEYERVALRPVVEPGIAIVVSAGRAVLFVVADEHEVGR